MDLRAVKKQTYAQNVPLLALERSNVASVIYGSPENGKVCFKMVLSAFGKGKIASQ